jgi:hypothetical protein
MQEGIAHLVRGRLATDHWCCGRRSIPYTRSTQTIGGEKLKEKVREREKEKEERDFTFIGSVL